MSAQWGAALLDDGGRLISIAQARAATDYRSFHILAELIFDPRQLGILTAWQQRIAGASSAEPLFPDVAPELDADLATLEAAVPEPAAPAAPVEIRQAPAAPVAPTDPVKSTTYGARTQQISDFTP